MMNSASVKREWRDETQARAQQLCDAFLNCPPARRFVFGRNVYTEFVAAKLDLAGVVDDFTTEASFAGLPVIRSDALPADAIVLAASGGRPLTVRTLLDGRGIENLDYFALQKWGGLDLPDAIFNESFRQEFDGNTAKIDWLFDRLADDESRRVLNKLLSFKHTYDLSNLEGFSERQTEQYFEDFFKIRVKDAVFVDVGGFDGYTSEEFIRLCPDYKAVYIFEPEAGNNARCAARLAAFGNITVLPFGAGSENATLRFSSDGSASSIREDGECEIQIRRIDDVVPEAPTFIKMDIEGAELMAIDGAQATIATHKPVLAIAVYHRPSDIWTIPEKILSLCAEYKLYIRHYTESIYETVMYFVPPAYEAD